MTETHKEMLKLARQNVDEAEKEIGRNFRAIQPIIDQLKNSKDFDGLKEAAKIIGHVPAAFIYDYLREQRQYIKRKRGKI